MLKQLLQPKNQRGDTIIEVLISIAIVSLVLASAYAITNRNVATSQDTQEHGQALLIVQRQIELLRASSGAYTNGGCILPNVAGDGIPTTKGPGPDNCKFVADGSIDGCTDEPCYQVVITKPGGVYEVTVTWASLNGNTSRVSMDYGI